ncbi:hypothetical protein PENFLA_c012G03144 [Penicillium flavigenum]|uniref:CCHC-type domain-containing protein n=1 Tax=Penicillium flavigenum TaxID=254877 RepID=A0A1V6T448_9EURO|nr:hypothetical protein PENFLA_c017G00546 [Penicillium flavigenum]OQE20921.1 hypothetical protein PENFLA_c015G03163 [Penicillium flavigenum]OQE22810.1 hypothetical protein PENFLA_c012G03144 [Penicillium flavigenum]
MVTQLQEITELRSSIEIRNNEMKKIKDPAKEITINDFFQYYTDMQDKIKEFGIDRGGIGASAVKPPKTQASRQTTPASDRKKEKLMNAPPPGKYARKHVKEWRNHKTQRTANRACSFCGMQGHNAKDCYHLKVHDGKTEFNENKSQQFASKPSEKTRQANFDTVASSATTATSSDNREYDFSGMAIAESEADLEEQAVSQQAVSQQIAYQQEDLDEEIGIAASAVTMPTRQLRAGIDWVLDSGSSWHICSNRDLFISYRAYKPGEGPGWDSSAGLTVKADGVGDIILPIRMPDGSRYELQVHCLYKPGNRFNLLSFLAIRKQKGISWTPDDMIIRDKNKDAIGYTFVGMNVPFIELANEPNPVLYNQPSIQPAEAVSYALISAELAHRRLGHAGSYKGRINKDKLGEDVSMECYDCEPCHKAKSKKIVSREKQARATKVGQLVHVDLHPYKPKGLSKKGKYDREHAMIITDDASRFRTTICIAKKGYYPTEWRFDNGTEFSHFKKWAEEKSLLVSLSAAYAHEQNGVAEFSGHYVMQIARTMHIDGGAPKELWTEACYATTYIINRLTRPGEDAPIVAWRKAMNLRGEDAANLSFLRVWYSKAYVHQAKETRVQSMKMDPRAWIGFLVGYEGDNGHCFRIYDPKTKKVTVHRDVVFWEPRAPKTYDGVGDFIGETVEMPKTEFSIGKALFKTARQAAKDLGSTDLSIQLIRNGTERDQSQSFNDATRNVQHVSSGDEHLVVTEGDSIGTDDAELYYNTEDAYETETVNTLEDRVHALRKRRETPDRQMISPPQSTQSVPYQVQPVSYPGLPEIPMQQPVTPSPTPSPLAAKSAQQQQIQLARQAVEQAAPRTNPARLNPPEILQPTLPPTNRPMSNPPSTTAPPSPRRSARSNKGQSPERYADIKWKNVGFAISSTEAGPEEGSVSTGAEGNLKAWRVKIPRTYTEAINSQFKGKWHEAMEVQLGKLRDAKAYEIVPKPPAGSTILPGKWVYDLKIDKDNTVREFRARWVICGNRQRPGYDFDENYAPVARGETMRLFLSIAAVNSMIVEQVDYTTAYLNAMVDNRVIFMRQPTGFEISKEDNVCLMLQALDLGKPARFLGSSLSRTDNGAIFLNQFAYTEEVIVKAGLQDASQVYLPMRTDYKSPDITRDPKDKDAYDEPTVSKVEATTFLEDIGKIGWLADKSRPDIALAVNKLQRRAAAPRQQDIDALKQLIRYLKGSMKLGILLGKNTHEGLIGYVDASYQDCEDGKSTEAFIFFYAGAPVSWSSRKEEIVARSSTSAEYIAFDAAIREAMWLYKIMTQIGIYQDLPITLFTDSDNAFTIITKDNYSKATKWINARYHFVRHAVRQGIVSLQLIPSIDNVADALTKPLGRELFEKMRDRIMHKQD